MPLERKTILSPDRVYRYTLWREWDPARTVVQFVGLNPSTADETKDDPTIRRCVNFAKSWGYGALCMTNLFAFRATDPHKMLEQSDPIGPDNDEWLHSVAEGSAIIVCAWGKPGRHLERSRMFLDKLPFASYAKLTHLGLNADGSPKHPLYLKSTTQPNIWRG